MRKVVLSSDESGRLANHYRQYERVQRTTPSGRTYDFLTMIERDGSGTLRTVLLAPDKSRAVRFIARSDFGPRIQG